MYLCEHALFGGRERRAYRSVLDLEEYERLREIEDEMEDIRRFDAAIDKVERGEADFVPWKEAKREIEAEREELRHRGEL